MEKRFKMRAGFLKLALILLFVGGVLSGWDVQYHNIYQQHICAVKGSSVVILCSFTYPNEHRVVSVMWGRGQSAVYSGPFIYHSELNETSSQYQYIGDKKHNCSFKILQVEHRDAAKFTFRFETTNNSWTGKEGPTLQIVDLNISMTSPDGKETVKEGDTVTLTCTSRCNDTLAWFRNGDLIKEGPELNLGSISTTSSGNYTCSVKNHPGTTSRVMHIDVEYSPRNTSVSVKPSAEVDAGSSVTLVCSSNGNPVESYTWFRKDNNGVIAVGHQPEHHIKEFFQHNDQYFCTATNKHGSQNSSVVTITAKEQWAAINRNILIISICSATLLIVITVVIITRILRKTTTSIETDSEETQNTIYVNWLKHDTSQSQEGTTSEPELIYATVNFNTKREADMAQQIDSHDNDGCAIYSTVCRTQTLNLSYVEP